MFYVDWELGGRNKNIRLGSFFRVKTCKGRVTGNKQIFYASLEKSMYTALYCFLKLGESMMRSL